MKIRGESGSMPARMGGGARGASRGGKVLNRVKANVKDKLENSETAVKIANTKPVAKATKVAVKAVKKATAAKRAENRKKTINTIVKMQQKTKAEQIAKNSVKVVPRNAKKAGM